MTSRTGILAVIFALAFSPLARAEKKGMHYPPTKAEKIVETMFGVSVSDPYRWLEDAAKPDVKAWMDAQDKLARAQLAKLPGRAALVDRLKALLYVDVITPPVHRGTRYFYSRRHADKEKSIYYWREGESGAEQVLLDPNAMSKDGTISLGEVVPSWDGKKVAYTLRANNSDEAVLHVIDVASGKESEIDRIDGAKYAQPSWTPKNDGFYYTWLPPVGDKVTVADRPGFAEVRFHKLGADPKSDALVHEKTGNPESFIGATLSKDGHWLFVYVQHGWNSTDVWFRDTRDPAQAKTWKPFAVGKDAQYNVDQVQDVFYVHTNEGAPRWRVFQVQPAHVERSAWKEIVPEQADAVLERAYVVGGKLACTWLKNASSTLELRGLDGKPVRKIELPGGIGTSPGLQGEPDEDTAYYEFVSFTQPLQIFKTSIAKGDSKLWNEVKVPVDPSPFVVEQVWYPSKDGTKISMFVIHRKDLKKDGSTPFLLTGYGGFNVSYTPGFQATIYPWLEAGGGYAIPNLRGGGEYGEAWHRAGMREHKQNVFDDFIAAAEYLVKEGYTSSKRLAIRGGSNGGLLMGAATTQRPDLFRAVICQVPLLDMIRYHLFGSGKTWIPEYGSAADESGFKTLFAYSPYHHVRKGTAYPSLLMMSADSDDRVDPMHARKMTAALQAAQKASDRPILLRIEQHSGHGGADLVKQTVEQQADAYVFLMHELGLKAPASK